MGHSLFLRRLRRELPVWVERGWVQPGGDAAIIEHVAAARSGKGTLIFALAVLGVLLLGSGVITFFAANWPEMSKLSKLGVLAGSMWMAYAAAAHWLNRERSPRLGQAMMLLAVLLYGANIFLIAQIYHIDSHYPDGVLLWVLGALAAAWLGPSQPAAAAGLILAVLWTGMETLGFERGVNWAFLPVWAAFLLLVYRCGWRASMHLALLALMAWSAFTVEEVDAMGRWSELYLLQVYFLLYLGLFVAGMLLATYPKLAHLAPIAQRYGALASVSTLFVMTFPTLQAGYRWWTADELRTTAPTVWQVATVAALAIVVILALWHRRRTGGVSRPAYLRWGEVLVAAAVLLVLANLYAGASYAGVVAVALNLLFFAGTVWLIYAGLHTGDRFLVNLGFAAFAVALLSRYFDTFWTLMDRSFFFMGGGVLLLAGGYFLERQRRRVTVAMERGNGETKNGEAS